MPRGIELDRPAADRDGRQDRVPLTPHAEIVLEVGPQVPPHTTYTFPPGS
jgi:hypothetical protein